MYADVLQRGLFEDARTADPANLCVIGVGDAGCRAAYEVRARLSMSANRNVKVICIDTDFTSLTRSSTDESLLLGAATLRGFGSGGDPAAAAQAAAKSADVIGNFVSGVECVLVVAGVGGGTGSGAAPVIASIARDAGALVISVAIMPFDFEGIGTHLRASDATDRLRQVSDVVLETLGDGHSGGGLTLSDATEKIRCHVASFALAITSIVTASADRSNVTAAHLRSVLRDGASAIFGTAEGRGNIGVKEAAEMCVNAALASRSSTGGIDRAIILIEAGPELPLAHIATAMSTVESRLGEVFNGATAELHLGVYRSRLLAGTFRVSIVGTMSEMKRQRMIHDQTSGSKIAAGHAKSKVRHRLAGLALM